MRVIAAFFVCLSFFATHAAGEALTNGLAIPADGEAQTVIELTVDAAEMEAGMAEQDDRPCTQGECLFIVPTDGFVVSVGVAAIGDSKGASAHDRPGRMVHPPPIS